MIGANGWYQPLAPTNCHRPNLKLMVAGAIALWSGLLNSYSIEINIKVRVRISRQILTYFIFNNIHGHSVH